MPQIRVTQAESTGLDPVFSSVASIELEDQPLGAGGFGEVYRVVAVNGRRVPAQVVKLLFDQHGIARRNLQTIRELQRRLRQRDQELRATSGRSLLESYPGLLGAPQFSFEGIMNGRPVSGYSANDLTAMGMEQFSAILESDQKVRAYQALPLETKLQIAGQLVTTFEFLSSRILFIHADMKAEALFVDTKKLRCAMIDFDSGALAQRPDDQPSTYGTLQDWLAPEVARQLATGRPGACVQVNLLCDVWSINVALHYLLCGLHPYFFLAEISERSMRDYLSNYRWPEAGPRCSYFRSELSQIYRCYLDFLRRTVPEEIIRRFQATFNEGYADPSRRTTYGQWRIALVLARTRISEPPVEIQYFVADRQHLVDDRPVQLTWRITGPVARAQIHGIGDVTGRSSVRIPAPRSDTTLTLEAQSPSGKVARAQLRITVSKQPPRIERFEADNRVVVAGRPVLLRWRVSNDAREVHLSGVGRVDREGSVQVWPRTDQVYQLCALSYFGAKAESQISIRVCKEPPRIIYFWALPSVICEGQSVELSWKVEKARSVEISPGLGSVPPEGRRRLQLTSDTVLTLAAHSAEGAVVKAERTVRVFRPTKLALSASQSRSR